MDKIPENLDVAGGEGIGEIDFNKLEFATKQIQEILVGLGDKLQDGERLVEMLKSMPNKTDSFLAYIDGKTDKYPNKNDIVDWKNFLEKKGETYAFFKKCRKMMGDDVIENEAEVDTDSETETVFKPEELDRPEILSEPEVTIPEPEVMGPPEPLVATPEPEKIEVIKNEERIALDDKLATLKITQQEFEALPGFEQIKDDAGRQLFVLNNLEQVKYETIKDEAEREHELYVNESKWRIGKIWRGVFKGTKIQKRAEAIVEKGFGLDKISDEASALISVAAAGPELTIDKDGEGLIAKYLEQADLDQGLVENYNKISSTYATLPRESDRKNYSKAERERFQEIKNEFEKQRRDVLNSLKEVVGETKALAMINTSDFRSQLHNSLINHPEAETALSQLEKKDGVISKLSSLNSAGIAGGGTLFAGLKTNGIMATGRYGAKSAAFAFGGVVGAGVSGAVLAGAFGAWRGRKGAREKLDKRDKDMEEGKKTEYKKGDKDFVKPEVLLKMLEVPDGDKLSANIFYARKKLDDRQIIFGNQKEALAHKLNLLQAINRAEAAIEIRKGENGKGTKQKIGSLKAVIKSNEEEIQKQRKSIKTGAAIKGGLLGATIGGSVFAAGHGALGHFIHHDIVQPIAHDNPNLAVDIEKSTIDTAHDFATHDLTEYDIHGMSDINSNGFGDTALHTFNTGEHGLNQGLDDTTNQTLYGSFQDHGTDMTKVPNGVMNYTPSEEKPFYDPMTRDYSHGIEHDVSSEDVDIHHGTDMTHVKNFVAQDGGMSDQPKPFYDPMTHDYSHGVEHKIDGAEHTEELKGYVLGSERASRESALIDVLKKEYMKGGMSEGDAKHQAGVDAHIKLREIFGRRGEASQVVVHKGDEVQFLDKNGNITHTKEDIVNVKVIPKGHTEALTHEQTHDTLPKKEIRGKHVHANDPDKQPKTIRPKHVSKSESGGKNVVEQEKDGKGIVKAENDGKNVVEKSSRVQGGGKDIVKPDGKEIIGKGLLTPTSKESLANFSNIEVKDRSDLVVEVSKGLSKDPRFMTLDATDQKKVLAKMVLDNFVGKGPSSEEFYSDLGVEGSPWDIKPGSTLDLTSHFEKGTDPIKEAFKAIGNRKYENAGLFIEAKDKFMDEFAKMKPGEITEKNILDTLNKIARKK